ncbi:MAG TPA: biotin--[acetyl-CoA-carboxylase] ligase [Acidimicrobiia bacterium]|jgi:BirA family biotin operon repressor/biotin-[acetyl-CoA-carboxylase] ligase|nr:biotin--[acetyl-CoA-carboxylase] ligase [Acidimicrobiia bacterium]
MADPPASPGVQWHIRRFTEIDSTNRYVLDAARAGAPPGLVVVADHQHAGRGRRGRAWTAPPGSSLLVSVLLGPPPEPDHAQVLAMAAGLALAAAVRAVAGFDAELKWPNDLVVGDRKLAGLLAETDARGGRVRSVVVGIGCNVTWVGFPPELAETATACDREAGHAVDRGALLDALLDALAAELAALDAVPARYRSRLGTLGQEVRVELATGTLEGAAVDVDEHGRLAVQPPTGPPVLVGAGDVIHLRRVTDPGPRPPAP